MSDLRNACKLNPLLPQDSDFLLHAHISTFIHQTLIKLDKATKHSYCLVVFQAIKSQDILTVLRVAISKSTTLNSIYILEDLNLICLSP